MLFSAACERNQDPILAVLRDWLPPAARVLEIGSGSGQHAVFFSRALVGVHWQPSETPQSLADLRSALASQLERSGAAAAASLPSSLPEPIALDVRQPGHWPRETFDAVFTANTCHIMPAPALGPLLAGSLQVLRPGGLLLVYGPFHDNGVHNAASNAAFDAHLRQLDPAMGLRDAVALQEQARALGLQPLAELAMPANNRMLVLRAHG